MPEYKSIKNGKGLNASIGRQEIQRIAGVQRQMVKESQEGHLEVDDNLALSPKYNSSKSFVQSNKKAVQRSKKVEDKQEALALQSLAIEMVERKNGDDAEKKARPIRKTKKYMRHLRNLQIPGSRKNVEEQLGPSVEMGEDDDEVNAHGTEKECLCFEKIVSESENNGSSYRCTQRCGGQTVAHGHVLSSLTLLSTYCRYAGRCCSDGTFDVQERVV